MNRPLLSVIVPVYNAENDLRRCLDSLLHQTYAPLEIVLIDDGSTDSSAAICAEYARVHAQIRFFHKENGGVSSARNLGLAKAEGALIGFCDADDWVDADYYERMARRLEESGAEMVFFGY